MPINFEARKLPMGGKLIRVPVPGARPGTFIKILEAEAIAQGLMEAPEEGKKKEEPRSCSRATVASTAYSP